MAAAPAACEPAGVSIAVDLADLAEAIAERGPAAYLVTVRDTRPHIVQVEVGWRGDALVVAAGRRTSINVATHPEVALLWPVDDRHPHHSLLVDATARVEGEALVLAPTHAVLHRAGGRRRRPPVDGGG